MKRSLRLRREALSELTPADLLAVRGGYAGITVGDHCGPPFDTTFLRPITTLVSALYCPPTS